jgi:hypothetical protein
MDDDCTINPDFCNFNRVHLVYCDVSSGCCWNVGPSAFCLPECVD